MMGHEIGGPGALRFVANADGTELRSIPERLESCWTWSPDGSRIVCSDYSGNNILVVDIATGEASRVAKGGAAISGSAGTCCSSRFRDRSSSPTPGSLPGPRPNVERRTA